MPLTSRLQAEHLKFILAYNLHNRLINFWINQSPLAFPIYARLMVFAYLLR